MKVVSYTSFVNYNSSLTFPINHLQALTDSNIVSHNDAKHYPLLPAPIHELPHPPSSLSSMFLFTCWIELDHIINSQDRNRSFRSKTKTFNLRNRWFYNSISQIVPHGTVGKIQSTVLQQLLICCSFLLRCIMMST
mmetsp:Transcript_6675/g.9244  ORF Transcript_6675/g.9244 Transcript_6675/m.9244 type:complete len:136 (+) Transcript_6675:1971-2378(+)